MEIRIQSKHRSLVKQYPVPAPHYGLPFHPVGLLERIVADSDGSRLLKSRKSDKRIFTAYRIFQKFSE